MKESLTVGEIATLAGVTVRTLHHYDEIGLVSPGERTDAGYRTYGRADVERLQEVLFFRELGFALKDIKAVVTDPAYKRSDALNRQRALLETRQQRMHQMIDLIDRALEAERTETIMTNEESLGVFGDFDPAEYEEEARERWGDSDPYKQSAQRTAQYTKQDWEAISAEADAINDRFLALMAAGTPPSDAEAMEVAEAHRGHISKWFYDCSKEIHAGLGEMYVADERFTANIDKAGEGLAAYMSAAIAANTAR